MGFISAVLDDEVAYGFEGGPRYSTNVTDLENGLREPDGEWLYGRHEYSAKFDNLPDPAREAIINVFHAARGKRHDFKFKDWNDFTATFEPLNVPAELVGTTQPVQLYKTYTFGPAYTIRPVQAIKVATVFLGAAAVPGTVDIDTGLFYPAAAWEVGEYTWSGEFYVWVHFTNDYNPFTINSWQASTASIDLEEGKRKITATNVPASWAE
jgi:uncharacterized protein (TIGR02217 family)